MTFLFCTPVILYSLHSNTYTIRHFSPFLLLPSQFSVFSYLCILVFSYLFILIPLLSRIHTLFIYFKPLARVYARAFQQRFCFFAVTSVTHKEKVGFHPSFSRHGITRASSVLLIWLNENVGGKTAILGDYKSEKSPNVIVFSSVFSAFGTPIFKNTQEKYS